MAKNNKKNNKLKKNTLFLLLLKCLLPFANLNAEPKIFFREDFKNLENWKPLIFPKIKQHTKYSIKRVSDQKTLLETKSSASASGIIYKGEFNIYQFPRVRWKWKVSNLLKKGNAKSKKGDDYPIRVYILFKYDPKLENIWSRAKYRSAKLLHGEYPPAATLNYIWANKNHPETIITSTYTERAKLILMDKGSANLDQWREHEINILEDYQKAFGKKPPQFASLAIMNDSDNTGEEALSYVDFIEIGK